jgi:hypothetical protein
MAEREKIEEVLEEVGGDRARAAEVLGVSGKTLLHKMREYGLVPPGGPREGISTSPTNDDPTEVEGGAGARPPSSRTGSKNDV